MTNNKWFDPLYDLIEDRLKLLRIAPALKQDKSQDLQPDNHQAFLGKYMLMCQEYLSAEEQTNLFQANGVTPAQRLECIGCYLQFVRNKVNDDSLT